MQHDPKGHSLGVLNPVKDACFFVVRLCVCKKLFLQVGLPPSVCFPCLLFLIPFYAHRAQESTCWTGGSEKEIDKNALSNELQSGINEAFPCCLMFQVLV